MSKKNQPANTNHAPTAPIVDRATALRLAAACECDPRLATRILQSGPGIVRSVFMRERAARVLAEMGITTPLATTSGGH